MICGAIKKNRQLCSNNARYKIKGVWRCGIHKSKSAPPRSGIPKAIRNAVWNKWYGDVEVTQCVVCKGKLLRCDYHCGHIVSHANGGFVELANLIPLCRSCNLSMGRRNVVEYMDSYKIAVPFELRQAEKIGRAHV